jgi:cardiolipin synthase
VYSLVMGGLPKVRLGTDAPSSAPPGTEGFEALLDSARLPPRSKGSVEFFVDGPPFFAALDRAINAAHERIDVQTYIFDNDTFAMEVAERLKRKSHEVPVRVYFDTMGSITAGLKDPEGVPESGGKRPPHLAAYLKEDSRIEVRRTTNPFFMADHTKLQVFDDRIAFIGGMNVGAEYRYTWHDMMARIEGPIVQEMADVFDDHWRGEDWFHDSSGRSSKKANREEPDHSVPSRGAGHVPLRRLLTDVADGRREILKAATLAIRHARERVWIQTPYFTADEISGELEQAVKRGVEVRVILPEAPDSKLLKKANVEEVQTLLRTGAKIYEYPGMTHLKATICDGWAMFGSANYDTLSMRINLELNLATSDEATVAKLERMVFAPDFRRSRLLTLESARSKGGLFTEILGDQM